MARLRGQGSMVSESRCFPLLVTLLIWGNFNSMHASSEFPSSSKSSSQFPSTVFLKNRDKPAPRLTIDEAGSRKNGVGVGHRDPPGSPVKLFMPDEFQFYTLDGRGQLIMKQMSKEEIQGMIAASVGGGDSVVNDEGVSIIHSGQKYQAPLANGVPQISDVVHNVQKVLKGELNKPVPVRPLSSSIPGSVNSQWTNMLPYILSAGSADQQNIDQDSSIVLTSTSDNPDNPDNSNVHQLPMINNRPTSEQHKPMKNNAQMQPASDKQGILLRLTSRKPTSSGDERPIYLLGDMALDADILEDRETYNLSTRDKTKHGPTATPVYKTSTTREPAVSSLSHLTGSLGNDKNDGQPDAHRTPIDISKPNESEATVDTMSKTTTLAEHVIGSTQRTSLPETTDNEKISTLPNVFDSITNTANEYELTTTRYKETYVDYTNKPEIIYTPSSLRHTMYDLTTKPTALNLEARLTTKFSNSNRKTSSRRPEYHQSFTKIHTDKFVKPTEHSAYEATSNENAVKIISSAAHEASNQVHVKLSTSTHKSISTENQPMYGIYAKSTTADHPTEITEATPLELETAKDVTNVNVSVTQQPTITRDKINNNHEYDNDANAIAVSNNSEDEKTDETSITNKRKNNIATNGSSSLNVMDKPNNNHNAMYSGTTLKLKEKITWNDTSFNVDFTTPLTIHSMPSTAEEIQPHENTNNFKETTANLDVKKTLSQESKTENNYNYYSVSLVEKDSTGLPEATSSTFIEVAETTTDRDLDLDSREPESNGKETKGSAAIVKFGDNAQTVYGQSNEADHDIEVNAKAEANATNIDNLQTWIYNGIATDYAETYETTTEYLALPDNTHKDRNPILNTHEERLTVRQDTTSAPLVDNDTTDRLDIETTMEYGSTLRDKINESDETNVLRENSDGKVNTTPAYINSYEAGTTARDKLITQNLNKASANVKTSSEINDLPTERTTSGSYPEIESKTEYYAESALNLRPSTVSPGGTLEQKNSNQSDSLNNNYAVNVKEKFGVMAEGFPVPVVEENHNPVKVTTNIYNNVFEQNSLASLDHDASTIKVIPVYDDDTSLYLTLPPSPSNRDPDAVTMPSNSKLPVNTDPPSSPNVMQLSVPTNQEQRETFTFTDSLDPSIRVKANVSAQSNSTFNDIALNGTLNSNAKEPYESPLSTAGNYYSDALRMKIQPIVTVKNHSNEINEHHPALTTQAHIKMDPSNYPATQLKLQFDTTLPVPEDTPEYNNTTESVLPLFTLENLENPKTEQALDSVTRSTYVANTEYTDDDSQVLATNGPERDTDGNVRKPTIHVDSKNSDSDLKQGTSNNYFTSIKVKNPVTEGEKIRAVTRQKVKVTTSPTMLYTSSNYSKKYSNIASGIIAGYPTYNRVQATTEYVAGTTTLYDIVYGTNNSNTSKSSVDLASNTNLEEDYQGKLSTTFIIRENDINYVDKTTSVPAYLPDSEKDSTSKDEFQTSAPLESTSLQYMDANTSSQTQEKYDSSLEKINHLIINRLMEDKGSSHGNLDNDDYSNHVTTNVPLETIVDESISTAADEATTLAVTTFDQINKVNSTSLENGTYVRKQDLPLSEQAHASGSKKVNDASVISKEQNVLEALADDDSKVKSGNGTISTTIATKPATMKAPYLASPTTHSLTNKGLFEKIQSAMDKSVGRINLEEEKNKVPAIKSTELPKFPLKNKNYYTTDKRSTIEGYQSYGRKTTRPVIKSTTIIKDYTTSKSTDIPKDGNDDKLVIIPQKNTIDQPLDAKQTSSNGKEGSQPLNPQIVTLDHATGAIGLDQSNKGLDKDISEFLSMCNELSFKFWTLANTELSSSRSITLSPFGMISTLAMIFLGARGLTSNQMNDILKLDDVVTFNPHLVFQNITDTVTLARGQGIQNAAFVRALYADRLKVRKIMPFYKEQAQQFYEGAVVDVNFSTAGDILRRRTNLLIRKQTGGRIKDFVKAHALPLRSPLTALSANVFQTSCDGPDASSEGRDGEMYFAVAQTVKQRKLVPIPAVVWKTGVSAGYEPSLDATAVALGDARRPVSLIMVMPGQQGLTAAGDNLERLEHRLFGNAGDNALEKLLKVIVPRRVDVQIPRFSHRSIVNVTSALKKLGFEQLFTKTADLKGINGAGHDLYLADMLQMNLFYTCGDENKLGSRPLSETFPTTSSRHTRAWGETISNIKIRKNNFDSNEWTSEANVSGGENKQAEENNCEDLLASDNLSATLAERPESSDTQLTRSGKWDADPTTTTTSSTLRQKLLRQKRLWWLSPSKRRQCRNRRQAETDKPRMKMDKPFLYLIRHNLTGLILHIGRFNPKNQS